jgi:hypothetical protein
MCVPTQTPSKFIGQLAGEIPLLQIREDSKVTGKDGETT